MARGRGLLPPRLRYLDRDSPAPAPDLGTHGLLSARRFPPIRPAASSRSPVFDGREAPAASRGACRKQWAARLARTDRARGRAEGRGSTSGGGRCTSGSRGRPPAAASSGRWGRAVCCPRGRVGLQAAPRGASLAELAQSPVLPASWSMWGVGSGQCAASARQVPANFDELLPETLARLSLRLILSAYGKRFCSFCSKQTWILYLFYTKQRPDFQCDSHL